MSLLFKFRPLVVNPELAQRIGLNEAIVLQQLNYWLSETDSGVEHDGRRWVYNTLEQWQKQFPFWSVDTIKRTLSSLQKLNIVVVEQLNKSKHDRTNFYTINRLASALIDEGNLHSSDEGKLHPSNDADCTDLLTEITTKTTAESNSAGAQAVGDLDQAMKTAPKQKAQRVDISIPEWVPQAAWADFVDMRKKIRAPLTERAKELAVKELDRLRQQGHLPEDVLEQSVLRSWKGLFPVKGDIVTTGTRGYSRQSAIEANNQRAAEEFVGGNW